MNVEAKRVESPIKEAGLNRLIRKVNSFDFLTTLRVGEDSPIRKSRGYNFVVDTLSVSSLSALVFGANELLVANMKGKELLRSRGMGLAICVFASRPYGMLRDWCFRKMGINEDTGQFAKLVVDIAATELFCNPIYAVQIACVSGENIRKILLGVAGGAVIYLFYGRPLGAWMDFVRRASGARQGSADVKGQK